ncbi:MAG: Imm50 family immunity protein [Phycisphaerales bacterium]
MRKERIVSNKVYYDPFLLKIYNKVPSFEAVRVNSMDFQCRNFVFVNVKCVMKEFPQSPPRHWANFNQLALTILIQTLRSVDVRQVDMYDVPSDIRFLEHDDCVDVHIVGGVEAVVRANDVFVCDLSPYAVVDPYR